MQRYVHGGQIVHPYNGAIIEYINNDPNKKIIKINDYYDSDDDDSTDIRPTKNIDVHERERYLLFGGKTYYPYGGWEDVIKSFLILEEAIDYAKHIIEQKYQDVCDWIQIIDLKTYSIVKTADELK